MSGLLRRIVRDEKIVGLADKPVHEDAQPDSTTTLDCTVRNLAITGVRNRDS